MTVRELMQALAQWDPDEEVIVCDFDDWDGGCSYQVRGLDQNERCVHHLEWTEVYCED